MGLISSTLKNEINSRHAAALAVFRMSKNNTLMSKNSDFLEACAAVFQTIPGNAICTNCLLTLQNVSFPESTRTTLLNYNENKIISALAHVINCPADEDHKQSRETAILVLSNLSISAECKPGLAKLQQGVLLKAMINVINLGDQNPHNVLAR